MLDCRSELSLYEVNLAHMGLSLQRPLQHQDSQTKTSLQESIEGIQVTHCPPLIPAISFTQSQSGHQRRFHERTIAQGRNPANLYFPTFFNGTELDILGGAMELPVCSQEGRHHFSLCLPADSPLPGDLDHPQRTPLLSCPLTLPKANKSWRRTPHHTHVVLPGPFPEPSTQICT